MDPDTDIDVDSEFDDFCEERTGLDKYFRVDSRTRLVYCDILDCNQPFKLWRSYNLKRHLKGRHRSVYDKLYPSELNEVKKLQISALELMLDAVELVTVNGQPFSLLNASAIKGFYGDKLNTLHQKRYRVKLNRKTIANDVDNISKEIIAIITEEMKNRSICLILDTCTKGTLSMLSICAQYMIDDEIIVRSLGVIELIERHTAAALTNIITNYIEKTFDLSMSQVRAVVTDNAANMLLTMKLLNKYALGQPVPLDADVESETSEDEADEEGQPSNEDEMEIENIISNNDEYPALLKSVAKEYARYYGCIFACNPISCSTHTYQLGIADSFSACNVDSIISKVNRLCKLVRTQIVQVELRKLGVKLVKPPLNNVTRWNSEYLMVIFFLRYKFLFKFV